VQNPPAGHTHTPRPRLIPEQSFLPKAYTLPDGVQRSPSINHSPTVVFIEVTNRCNLLCQTCPRTFFEREPLKSLSFDEFVTIAEQFPAMQRASLHGIGEPLLNRELPRIIRYLKQRHVQVVINSNGTLLTPRWSRALVESGLDEYRCSIDGANPATYARIRGANLFDRLVSGLRTLVETKDGMRSTSPRVSIWCVGTQENLQELPDLIRLAASLGIPEVYLQRLTYFAREPGEQYGMARSQYAVFGSDGDNRERFIADCEALSHELGIQFRASGARKPADSLGAARSTDEVPWQACMRPWTTAYITANGNCLPCCISPFATPDYDGLLLGNLFERPFAEIWNDFLYREFRKKLLSKHPHTACSSCGVYWSL
jgi:MoaA/NifB/PqqE/SkfB family radical SAM enzyme